MPDLEQGWPKFSLGSLTTKIRSGATPRGGQAAYLDRRSRFVLVRSQNVFDHYFENSGLANISDIQASELGGAQLEPLDVLLNITGDGTTFGRSCLVPGSVLPACVNQHVVLIRTDKSLLDARYLAAWLALPETKSYIESFNAGGSRRAITKGHIESFQVPLPPLQLQGKIGGLAEKLNARIDILRQTSATLEAISQALFKSWFVDFDPVRAKAEGREPDGMDAASAALFPSVFEEREGRTIPAGWSPIAVYDLAEFVNGAAYKAFAPNRNKRGLPIIKIAELKAGVTEQTAYSDVDMPGKYRISAGDILFSWSGNPDTSIDTFVWPSGHAWLNQHIFRVIPLDPHERSFVLTALKYLRPTFAEIARNKQTTGLGHVTVADLKRLKILKPSNELMERWSFMVDQMVEQVFENEQRAQVLVELRDTLLPRLMSGKLRLSDAEREVEAIA